MKEFTVDEIIFIAVVGSSLMLLLMILVIIASVVLFSDRISTLKNSRT